MTLLFPDAPATGANTGAHPPRMAGYMLVCSEVAQNERRFLNRVHWFDSGRGHRAIHASPH
jgi:hypothetical protein